MTPRRGQVLVVDDEPIITFMVASILGPEHDVTATNAAADALALIRDGQRFDLILCDLTMPQMSGMDLHAALSQVAPDQADRMVFLTGGAFTVEAQHFLQTVPNALFDKPFDNARLRAFVSERVG
jgi:CheY-like chemotaxis protein